MKTIFTFFTFLLTFSVSAQLTVRPGTILHGDPGSIIYSDLNLINDGTIEFENTGDLYVDSGFDNLDGTLTMNDAILHLGSDQARADGSHTLLFNPDTNPDVVKFVELGKETGDYTVTGGLLEITETFTTNSGTLNAEDGIVIKAPNSTDVAKVPEKTTSKTAVVNEIRIERHIPEQRAWRFMSSPVNSSSATATLNGPKSTIFQNWQQNGLNIGDAGYRPNIGTQITGGAVADGFDQNTTGFASMYTFDNATQSFSQISATNTTPLDFDSPYYILIRGDRRINLLINDFGTTAETVLEATGTLFIGDKNISGASSTGTGSRFILVSNPYQSPLNLVNVYNNLTTTGLSVSALIWDPKANIGATDPGQFNTVDLTDGSSITGTSPIVQPGQSFFLTNQFADAYNVFIEENDKNTTIIDVFSDTDTPILDGFLKILLYPQDLDVISDGFILKFSDDYDLGRDKYDCNKFFANGTNMSLFINDEYFAVHARPLPSDYSETMPLYMNNLNLDAYKFVVELEGMSALPNGIMLWDKYLDTYTTLTNGQTIDFTVDSNIPESIAADRFEIVYENETFSLEDNTLSNVTLYPNPVFSDNITVQFAQNQSKDTTVEIFNQLGQKVVGRSYDNIDSSISIDGLGNLSSGVYFVNVNQDNQSKTFKIIKN